MFSANDKTQRVLKALKLLEKATSKMPQPLTTLIIQEYGRDPYLILISTLLSLRARDTATIEICRKLFAHIRTPQEMVKLPLSQVEKLVYPTNYYKRKAISLLSVSNELIEKYNGKVPNTEEELLSLKGVGHKTAALVLGQAFNIPSICVDVHVHRISNRLGWVQTTNVNDTEKELKLIVPRKKWIELNHYLVIWGQNICVPISPFCSKCVLSPICPKIGVTKRR